MGLVAEYADWWNVPMHQTDRLEAVRHAAGTARISVQLLVTLIADERSRDDVVALAQRRFGRMHQGGHLVGTPSELRAPAVGAAGARRGARLHLVHRFRHARDPRGLRSGGHRRRSLRPISKPRWRGGDRSVRLVDPEQGGNLLGAGPKDHRGHRHRGRRPRTRRTAPPAGCAACGPWPPLRRACPTSAGARSASRSSDAWVAAKRSFPTANAVSSPRITSPIISRMNSSTSSIDWRMSLSRSASPAAGSRDSEGWDAAGSSTNPRSSSTATNRSRLDGK